jgi:hypothetical protein
MTRPGNGRKENEERDEDEDEDKGHVAFSAKFIFHFLYCVLES